MQERFNRVLWICIPVLLVGTIIFGAIQKGKIRSYGMSGYYFDQDVKVTLYEKDEKKADRALSKVKEIFETYQTLTRTDQNQLESLYMINTSTESNIKLSKKMSDFLNYGRTWEKKSEGKIHLQLNDLIETWEPHFQDGSLPTKDELDIVQIPSVDSIDIDNQTLYKSREAFLNTSQYEIGYTLKEIESYLKNQRITKYVIQVGSDTMVGEHYNEDGYKVALASSMDGEVERILSLTNRAMITKGDYQEQVVLEDGKTYGTIMDPITKYPSEKVRSVTVISKDPLLADTLSSILYQMDVEEGRAYLKAYDNVEAIWTTVEGNVVTTSKIDDWTMKEEE